MMVRALLLSAALIPGAATAQDDQTLADIKQQVSILFTEVQSLKRELSTTGAPNMNLQGTGALERIDAMEAELRRLTGRTEEIENRIDRVVSDGTNRIGDLRFRLCEIEEGCDFATLGETPPLGGDAPATPAPAEPVTDGAQMAVGEQASFDRAKEALDSGSFRSAAEQFETFTQNYTGGPLNGEAHFLRGQALSELGDDAGAARAYLESFSGQPEGARAPEALLQLGLKLDELGQRADACATLAEVPVRFPNSGAATQANEALSRLSCS